MKKAPIQLNTIYSTKEVMVVLGLGRAALQRRVKAGQIKHVLMGNKHKFIGQDLLEYMQSLSHYANRRDSK